MAVSKMMILLLAGIAGVEGAPSDKSVEKKPADESAVRSPPQTVKQPADETGGVKSQSKPVDQSGEQKPAEQKQETATYSKQYSQGGVCSYVFIISLRHPLTY